MGKKLVELWGRAWKWALGIAAALVISAGLMFAGSRLPIAQQPTQESARPTIVRMDERPATAEGAGPTMVQVQEETHADAYEVRLEQLGKEKQAALSATGYSVLVEGIRDAQKAPVLQVEIEHAYQVDVRMLESMRGEDAKMEAYESWTGRIAQIAPEHVRAHAEMDAAYGAGRIAQAQYWQEHRELERIFKQLARSRGEAAKQRYGEFGRRVAGTR